jgi:hypothetical protein
LEHDIKQSPILLLFHKTSTKVTPIQDLKLALDIDLQTYVKNPSLTTPLVSSSIFVALTMFKRMSYLSLGLQPPGQLFESHVWSIPNFNVVIQDSNPSVMASSTSTNQVHTQQHIQDK